MMITALRSSLAFTQAELSRVLGVHPMTVSKWERGIATPTAHQKALLDSFAIAVLRSPSCGEAALNLMASNGTISALYHLLESAYGNE